MKEIVDNGLKLHSEFLLKMNELSSSAEAIA